MCTVGMIMTIGSTHDSMLGSGPVVAPTLARFAALGLSFGTLDPRVAASKTLIAHDDSRSCSP